MFYPDTFQISTPSDREIRITRDFDAPRQLVFDAFTKPELVRRWLLRPPGWTMPICKIDLSVGGAYRYVWRKEGVSDMGLGGVFQEIVSPERPANPAAEDILELAKNQSGMPTLLSGGEGGRQSRDRSMGGRHRYAMCRGHRSTYKFPMVWRTTNTG